MASGLKSLASKGKSTDHDMFNGTVLYTLHPYTDTTMHNIHNATANIKSGRITHGNVYTHRYIDRAVTMNVFQARARLYIYAV